jgi:UDP-glucose 4-epimerase
MKPKKKAIVTGGAGFIGSHMVDLLLDRDFEVIVLDDFSCGSEKNLSHQSHNPKLSIEKMSILDVEPENKIFENCDSVFHFAGIGDIVPSIERPNDYIHVNVLGTMKILEACRYQRVRRTVYAASSSCYGIASTPTDETHQLEPLYPYAISKLQGEQLCFHWQNVYGLSVNSIRIFNAYGTRSRTSGAYGAVIGVFLKQRLANAPLTIVGDGMQSRDFVYVTDVAEAFWLAAETDFDGRVWNLGAGAPQSINYLASLIGGKQKFIPKRLGEPDKTHANITKINKDLGWSPRVSFEEGIENVIKNISYWEDAPLWTEDSIKEATKIWHEYMK